MLNSWRAWSIGVLTVAVGAPALVAAQQNWQQGAQATVVLRDGTRHEGRSPVYRLDKGEVVMRLSAADEPRVRAEQVHYIDFGGAQTTGSEQRGAPHLLVMRDGSTVAGRLVELGHREPSDRSSEYLVIFQTQQGEERRLNVNQVGRVYFGDVQATTGVGAPGAQPGEPGSITVPANQQWVTTGLTVRRGETLNFRTTGEVQLSNDPNDRARPAGAMSQRRAAGAPLPNDFAGALIARIGNGQPFAIGDQTSVQMPASGPLYLGINDDVLNDNQGQFNVVINRSGVRQR
jgi:hypothetical protein